MANKGWSGPQSGTGASGDGSAPDGEQYRRFDDECRGTAQRHGESLLQTINDKPFIRPTTVMEQFNAGGFTRLEWPVGGELPCVDDYPKSGNAGSPANPDGGRDGSYVTAAYPASSGGAA
jgi:hypothetical protein